MRVERLNKSLEINVEKPLLEIDLNLLNPLFDKYNGKRGNLIPLLQGAQDIYGWLPRSVFEKISEVTGNKLSDIYGVATFYAQFRLNPVGKYIIKVCDGTACHIKGSKNLISTIQNKFELDFSKHTTDDMLFTLETVSCLGACGLAPVIVINEQVYGQISDSQTLKTLSEIVENEGLKNNN